MIIDRSVKPNFTKEFLFSLPEIKNFKLNNNLEVLFVQKNQLPILQLNLIINAGSMFDLKEKEGLSNLTAMSIDEGAGKYNALQLSDAFDNLGSNFGVSCSHDNIFLSLQTLSENFEKSLELLSAVLINPHFKKDDFEREKRKILTRILQIKDNPDQTADIVFEYLLFGKENPYSSPVIGLENSVKNISVDDVKSFYAENFSPLNSALIVAGDSTEEILKDKLNTYLDSWNFPSKRQTNSTLNSSEEKTRVYLFDKRGSVQSEIRIGHLSSKRNEENYYSKLILNTILGGQFSSRINLNLREDKGYTYGASSQFIYYKNAGSFNISTSVGTENTGNAVKEIIFELNKIQEGVTQEELEFAKSSIIRRFPSNFETCKQIASNLSAKYIFSLPGNYFNNYIENIRKVSFDSVNKSAPDFIFPDKAVILIVGDKDKILNQFTELNIKNISLVDLTGSATQI